MSIIQVVKKLTSYSAVNDITQICLPLLQTFNLNYFCYSRLYSDSSFLSLPTHRGWYEHYFKKQFPIYSTIITSGIHLWQNYVPTAPLQDAIMYFQLYNGISIYTHNENYIELFDLTAPKNNHNVIDVYFNKLDIFDQFFLYFKYKAAAIIKQAEKERFIIPQIMHGTPLKEPSYDEFCQCIKTKVVQLNFKGRKVTLSRQEYNCLMQIAQHHTAKEAAKALHLSPRTVECYLSHIKNKTHCHFKSQLIDLFLENLATNFK